MLPEPPGKRFAVPGEKVGDLIGEALMIGLAAGGWRKRPVSVGTRSTLEPGVVIGVEIPVPGLVGSVVAAFYYLRLIKALSRTEIEQPRVFLFFIARNVARSLGKRRRFEAKLFRSATEADLGDIADAQMRTEQQVIARQQLRLVAAAIDDLPPRCREVFLLSAFDGLANSQIADRLGISQRMVEKHIAKAVLDTYQRCRDFF